MTSFKMSLSVIIPIGPNETELPGIISDLHDLREGSEVIFAMGEDAVSTFMMPEIDGVNCRIVFAAPGRASQMNAAALEASGNILWFLHADSRLSSDTVEILMKRLLTEADELLFHELRFLQGGPVAMPLNALGVWFRSNVLKMPFGDQGFCIKKQLFLELGRYPENAFIR